MKNSKKFRPVGNRYRLQLCFVQFLKSSIERDIPRNYRLNEGREKWKIVNTTRNRAISHMSVLKILLKFAKHFHTIFRQRQFFVVESTEQIKQKLV
jgi:hypothetical protein